MKATALLLCALGLALAASPNNNNNNMQKADKQFLQKQNDLMQLFMNVQQPSNNQQEQQQANNFSFQQQMQNTNNQHAVMQMMNTYNQGMLPRGQNQHAVKQMMNAYHQGMMPRGQVWNYNNPNHLQQAIQLFDLFYFAKDYNTFYQAACWARNNMNEGMFVYAMSVAILNRHDTQGIALPPQSEVNPHMYVNAQAIQQAQNNKQQGQQQAYMRSNHTNNYAYNMQHQCQQQNSQDYPFGNQNQNVNDNENHANQYQNQQQNNQEGRMSYYNEDINMNQQFAYEQLKNPAWFNNQKYNQNKQQNQNQNNGENFYYYFQQALARYNLERYANGMPNVHPIQFNQNIKPGYNPQMQYPNGQSMPARPNNMQANNANPHTMQQMMHMDRRIAEVVDSHTAMNADGSEMQMNSENGMMMLGNMMQNNGDSVNNHYYGANNGMYGYLDQCRRMVASTTKNNNYNYNMPSAIEHDHSANRDPVFYQCVSRMVNHFQNFKNQMKPYNMDQLQFQGVKVQSVNADKLVTYFDDAQMDMFNAIQYQKDEQPHKYQYIAQQMQLNNKPFNYQIQVHSDQETNAIVRVFIGPKYDAQGQQNSLEQARQNFVEIDRFVTHLKNGQNQISRNSQQSTRFVQPQASTHQMMNMVQQAMQGSQAYYYNRNGAQQQAMFPQNMMLPKGSRHGQEYMLAVAVHSSQGNQQDQQDNRPQGFPFDRVVREANFQQAQNIHFQTVKVYNKNQNEINNVV